MATIISEESEMHRKEEEGQRETLDVSERVIIELGIAPTTSEQPIHMR